MTDKWRWEHNMDCAVWGKGNVDKPSNCPEPEIHRRCDSDEYVCPNFRGLKIPKRDVFWGELLPGCCAALLSEEPDD